MAATPGASETTSTRRDVDETALHRMVRRLRDAPEPPWLHGEAARRLAERLAIVKLLPAQVLEWWPGLGGGNAELRRAYPAARVVAVEPQAQVEAPAPWWSPRRWAAGPAALAEDEVPAAQAQLVWANMMLHAVADPMGLMRRWQRALAVDGFLMFTTLGPGTLPQLRRLYASRGWGVPMAQLVDMHDLGDMLVQAGFADPVMDQEVLTLSWARAQEALDELRSMGGNAAPERMPGLRTPHWHHALVDALASLAADHPQRRVQLDFELVYGHAFKPAPRARVAAHSTVALDDMRAMVRAGRGRKP
jgi:malonyl-CoA O-methyltransferase